MMRRDPSGLRLGAVLLLVIPFLLGARFAPGGSAQQDKQELIVKLSSDINKVDHTIEVTKDLIKRSPDAPYLADLQFRLAELYVEKSRYVFHRIMEAQPEGQRSLAGEKSLEVQLNKKLAIETYDKVLKDFPEYINNDQIRFFKAHEFRELGEWDTMIKDYKELIEKHPRSVWSIEARLIIGDYHFDKGQLEDAESYYTAILDLPESHLHDMARYKLGWIRINQEDFKDALKLYEAAVTSKTKARRGAIGDARSLDIKRESLIALVWPFSEVRKAHQAPNYFRRLATSKTEYVEVMRKLANRYYIKTHYVNAALLYREIIKYSADVEQNVEYVQRIYEAVRNMSRRNPKRYANAAGDVDAIVKTLARFENHLKFKQEEKQQLEKDFEIRARDLATKLHVEAQKRRDVKSAQVASEAYRKYLTLFTRAKERRTIQINRAEALYQAQDYLEAGLQYEEIAKEMQDGNERRDMVYNAIVSFHKAIEADAAYRHKHPTRPGILDKLEILRSREGLKQLGAYYVKSWPKSNKTPNVKFNIARMYYQQGEYARAAELFAMFVETYPTHKDTPTAGNLALDALHKLDKYEELGALAKKFVDNRRITDAKFKNEVARIAHAARKRKVEFTVLSTSEGEFSEKMLAEWEKHKGTEEGEEFLYTAFVKYKSEGNVAGVFDFGGRLIGAYPKSTKLVDVFGTMAAFAAKAGDFDRAAFLFEEYHKRFPKQKNANDMLMRAATIRTFLGEVDKAAKDLRTLRGIGSAQQRRQAHQKLMELYRDIEDWRSLARVAQTALQDNPSWTAAACYIGIAYARQGKAELAERELGRAAHMRPNGQFDLEAKTQALFVYGQTYHRQFDDLQFSDPDTAEQILGMKLQLREVIEQAYNAAAGGGVGTWAIAAIHELARLHAAMGQSLANVPLPAMSQQELAAARAQLKGQADQWIASATEMRKACATKAEQLKIFTKYGSSCVTGGQPTVSGVSKRRRGGAAADAGYAQEMAELRQQLATRESLETVLKMARRAMQVGDYHLAKLLLAKASELDPRSAVVQNLIGVASWQLGEPQDAHEALENAARRRLREAQFNLAALYMEFGYQRLARKWLSSAGSPASIDTSRVEYHPSVEKLKEDVGS